jgi:hypothetical protein
MTSKRMHVEPYGGRDAKIRNVEPMKEGKVRSHLVSDLDRAEIEN